MRRTPINVEIVSAELIEKDENESEIRKDQPAFQTYYELEFLIMGKKHRQIIPITSWLNYFKNKKEKS